MGTINYYQSDYITLGIRPYSNYDFSKDMDFINELKDIGWNIPEEMNEAINDYIAELYNCDIENIKSILNHYNFYYYHIGIKPRYYEGFTLNIENNFPVCYDSHEDRKDAQKEITQIKKMLYECAGIGLVKCNCGWCMSYYDYNNTLAEIEEAIKEMRKEVYNIPTYRQLEKMGG